MSETLVLWVILILSIVGAFWDIVRLVRGKYPRIFLRSRTEDIITLVLRIIFIGWVVYLLCP
jgi:threonine/homoserine/homoserine lactone efflux protein